MYGAVKAPRKPPRQQTLKAVHIPAPVGGINTVDPALGLPELDCLKLFNMTAAELGLRVRSGYREWCTGMSGNADNSVRSVVPFSGSQKNGSGDRLFGVTSSGIWNCGDSTNSPERLITFDVQDGDAGYGTSSVYSTPAGKFLLYCDEENGLFIYTETTDSWAVGSAGTTQLWTTSTAYLVGNTVLNGGLAYICTTAGTSASSGGPTGTGSAITDGTAVWNYVRMEQTWLPSTGYLVDDTVLNDGKLYICVVAGTSGSTGPSGKGIHDDSVVWNYVEGAVAWAPSQAYYFNNKVTNGGILYKCTTAGTSASSTGPSGTGTGITDGTVVWSSEGANWVGDTGYSVDDYVINVGNIYICVTAGTSASSIGPVGDGSATDIFDGTVTWHYVRDHGPAAHSIGTSLADQQAGLTATPANFASVTAWKNRLWLVEKDTTRAWYLNTNSVFGTATSFDFGSKMRAGGPLANLYGWSYDAGAGMDSLLVALSTAGDVVIFQGTDPSSASTFGIKGSWSVGGVPYGRRIATEYGGELLIVSLLGVVPLSRLVVGQPVVAGDRSSYATDKVANEFNRLATTYQTNQGWAIGLHPQDNALLVLVPTVSGTAATPYAMSFSKRSWSQYRDLPILSMGVWNGTTYFGTPDGRLCQSGGYLDALELADPTAFSPIAWSLLSAYRNGGTPTQKRIHSIRVSIQAQETTPTMTAEAKYDLDLSEGTAPEPSTSIASAPGTWDNATWDSDVWAGEYSSFQALIGAVGMGREVAIAVRGLAMSRTSFVGADVYFDSGGLL
jgi:hypothetical protein